MAEDLDVGQACVVEGLAGLLGELCQVTRVDTDCSQALARGLHLLGNRDCVLDALVDVVGVKEQHAVLGARLGEGPKGVELGGKRHDP